MTVKNFLNCYADVVATYAFDNKPRKVKEIYLEQYRIFRPLSASKEKKETPAWDYNVFPELAKMKNVGN